MVAPIPTSLAGVLCRSGSTAAAARPGGPVQRGSTVELDSGFNSAIINSRLDAPAPSRVEPTNVLGLQGIENYLDVPCAGTRASGNLITAYTTSHVLSDLWSDGTTVDGEDALVDHNTVLDASDIGIALFGNPMVPQQSIVSDNYILSAGNSAFAAIDIDPHGVCGPSCGDVSLRSFAGSSVRDNVFVSGPRTGFGFGVSVGIRALFNYPPDGTGATVTDNGTGGASARVAIGIGVSGMFNATLSGNTGSYVLASLNHCPRFRVAAAVTAGLASFASIPQQYSDSPIESCWG